MEITDVLDFMHDVCMAVGQRDSSLHTIMDKYGKTDTCIHDYQGYETPYTPCDIHYYTNVSATLHGVSVSRMGIIVAEDTDELWLSCAEIDYSTWQEGIETIKKFLAAEYTDYIDNDSLGVYGETINLGYTDEIREQIEEDDCDYGCCDDEDDDEDDVDYGCKEEVEIPWWYENFPDTDKIPMRLSEFLDNLDNYKDTNIAIGSGCPESDRTWLSLYKTDNGWTLSYYYPYDNMMY